MSLKVGDTVKLKSGGPDMTVTRIGAAGGEPMVWCVWFEGSKDVYALFPQETLKAESAPAEPDKTISAPPQTLKPPLAQAESVGASPDPQAIEVDGAPLTPEPVEASQEPHTEPERESDIETQIGSIQSMINSLLKRS